MENTKDLADIYTLLNDGIGYLVVIQFMSLAIQIVRLITD